MPYLLSGWATYFPVYNDIYEPVGPAFMYPFLRLNSFLRKILNDSANSPVMSEKVMSFVSRDSMNCLRLSCVIFDWR